MATTAISCQWRIEMDMIFFFIDFFFHIEFWSKTKFNTWINLNYISEILSISTAYQPTGWLTNYMHHGPRFYLLNWTKRCHIWRRKSKFTPQIRNSLFVAINIPTLGPELLLRIVQTFHFTAQETKMCAQCLYDVYQLYISWCTSVPRTSAYISHDNDKTNQSVHFLQSVL